MHFSLFLGPCTIVDTNDKNAGNIDNPKIELSVDGNVLQVLSDIQEVTEECTSTLIAKEVSSDESTESKIGKQRV